jgi:hypothetical protein
MSVTNQVVGGNWCTTNWCTTNWCSWYTVTSMPIQITMLNNGTFATNIQMNWVFYNTTNMRILWQIASDGNTTSNNYTASSVASSDKDISNVRNDIIEKYWQSNTTNEWIQFDSGVGKATYIDTLAILGHNFSSSAIITLQGYGKSTDSAPSNWGSVATYAIIPMGSNPNDDRVIWCASTVPTQSYRYWRISINDPSNAYGYLRIGRFVAGQSLIFNTENVIGTLKSGQNNFKEEIKLNGFSAVYNNRALKRFLDISFNNLNIQTFSNKSQLNNYLYYNRDILKALVVIDPNNPYKYSVFAKLTQMPQEQVEYVDSNNEYTSFSLSLDEAK